MESTFWDKKYRSGNTGWDLGTVSPPLKAYIDQLTNKKLKILIPGGGNSYEAEYLHNSGFRHVFVADISTYPLNNLMARVPGFPKEYLINKDFFTLNGKFDLILEQTFFCALQPSLREAYVQKMHDLLWPDGKMAGVFFTFPLKKDGPPFGGSKAEYEKLFRDDFTIKKMETAYNSIPPRAGNELFFIMLKKRK